MPQDLTLKKGLFLQGLANAVVAFKGARDQLRSLQEEYNDNADLSGLTQADIDAAVAIGIKVAFMTPPYIANCLTVAQPHLEAILAGTGVAAGAGDLIHFLRLLPN